MQPLPPDPSGSDYGSGPQPDAPPPPPPVLPASGYGPPPETTPPPIAPGAGRETLLAVRAEVTKLVVGQDPVLACLLSALLVGGHVLLEGVPGVAKTLMVKALAASLDLDMKRIQFTPDLMPSDVTGQLVLGEHAGSFTFRAGPIFTNLCLADEVNRTPPKTQAALLEAMEERQVSVGGETRPLPSPFMVIATQNPIEYEGTYPLPEAQLDRFLFKVVVPYPAPENELTVLTRHHQAQPIHDPAAAGVAKVASAADILRERAGVDAIQVDPAILNYILGIVRATREAPSVALGVSPRGGAALLHASKAWAFLAGRPFVTPDDVKAVAKPVMRHRLLIRPEAALEGVTSDRVIDGLLVSIPSPR